MSKIIIIQDSVLMQNRIAQALEKGGYTNFVTFSSATAIARNPRGYLFDVDLIILDIYLPGITGIELAKILNETEKNYDIPIVFITSCNDSKTIAEAIRTGAADYIIKPFDDKILVEKVKTILSKSNSNTNRSYDAEDFKLVIHLEHERAKRGKQHLSFIKLRVDENDITNCLKQIKNRTRKIDSVYVYKEYVVLVLPITNVDGQKVVLNKILNHLKHSNIDVLENILVTYSPENPLSINDLLSELL
ncbi:MAG: response regulator [Bacillales bacterium]|jgi:DNA-binding response OmpR family regulator|nr:response regulator [Bacillales bacterium]